MNIAAVAFLALLIVCGIQIPASAQNETAGIDGVWRTLVTPRNCTTRDPLAPAFPGLFTINAGGTMAEYGISPGLTPALRSPGHGVWRKSHGWQDYSLMFVFLRYNSTGTYIGWQRITAAATVKEGGNGFSTDSTLEFYDANDVLVGTGCATAEAVRAQL